MEKTNITWITGAQIKEAGAYLTLSPFGPYVQVEQVVNHNGKWHIRKSARDSFPIAETGIMFAGPIVGPDGKKVKG